MCKYWLICILLAGNTSNMSVKSFPNNSGDSSYFHQNAYGTSTYAFGYGVNDRKHDNVQFRDERRYENGSVEGSFGYKLPDGRITITHYLANEELGYLTDTQVFEAGKQQNWQPHWPISTATKELENLARRPQSLTSMNVAFDKGQHLNRTDSLLPKQVGNALNEHGKDVSTSKIDLEGDLINPVINDVISGKVPLQQQTRKNASFGTKGVQIVRDLIPAKFPIIPFELPMKQVEAMQQTTEKQTDKADKSESMETVESTYKEDGKNKDDKEVSKKVETLTKIKEKMANNTTQSHTAEPSATRVVKANLETTTVISYSRSTRPTPKPLSDVKVASPGDQAWYEKIINDTRKEFLNNELDAS